MSRRIENKHKAKKKPPKIEKIKHPKDREDFLTNMAVTVQSMNLALNSFFTKFRQYGMDISLALRGLIELEKKEVRS